MQTLLTLLKKTAFTLGEACAAVGVNPRRATVWLQRSDNLPVPTGVRISERRRYFTGLEVTQLGVLARLVDLGHEVGTAAAVADRVVRKLAQIPATRPASLLKVIDRHSLPRVVDALVDLGLFVRPAGTSEETPDKVAPRLESISDAASASRDLIAARRAPESYTMVPIGGLVAAIAVELAWMDSEADEPLAAAIREQFQRASA